MIISVGKILLLCILFFRSPNLHIKIFLFHTFVKIFRKEWKIFWILKKKSAPQARKFFGVSFDFTFFHIFSNCSTKNFLFDIFSDFSKSHTRYFGFSKYYVIMGGGRQCLRNITGGGQNLGFLYYVICGWPLIEKGCSSRFLESGNEWNDNDEMMEGRCSFEVKNIFLRNFFESASLARSVPKPLMGEAGGRSLFQSSLSTS